MSRLAEIEKRHANYGPDPKGGWTRTHARAQLDRGELIAMVKEARAEAKENGTALNSTLLVLREAQQQIAALERENAELRAATDLTEEP